MSCGEENSKNERIVRLVAEQLGVSEEKVRERLGVDLFRDFAVDSLDVQELVLELEEELNDDGDTNE